MSSAENDHSCDIRTPSSVEYIRPNSSSHWDMPSSPLSVAPPMLPSAENMTGSVHRKVSCMTSRWILRAE
eukprot:CAMPEP_0206242724 /NCGR_PEP_ID=MMETSP0047_2-20121206/17213_1 /ASSEMBLY_ACC=CAM_ASM_000192 /TAXON_ID=195065 /ORGANISM="Chroomonas mesostigmatica_cf, Strain CCMP1168" /LENGTH=69 /DNA_ID=CAMNT_0053667769 /DNA_START=110 /DNA_END=319 /DNA_ORIENTATION=+